MALGSSNGIIRILNKANNIQNYIFDENKKKIYVLNFKNNNK